MNAVVNESRENLAQFPAPGPGERLKAARVSLGLEPAKIAAQLHLSADMVHAIERDDYTAMPARVFVRGYITNYARVVGLPAESLLKQLDEQFPDEGAKNGLNRVGTDIRRELRSSHGLVRTMTWVIVLGLAVLFVLWWHGHLDWRSQVDRGSTALVEDPAATMTLPDGDGMLALPGVYPDPLPAGVAEDRVRQSGALVPSETSPVPLNPIEAPLSGDSGSEPAPTDATDLERATETAAPAVAAPVDSGEAEPVAPPAALEPTPEPTPTATDDQVVIEFSAPCWVDIRDSERRFRLYGEMAAGRREILGGTPPYTLVIGNADGASLSVGGEPFDLATHTNGNVARFTLTTD
jgi:cytoskeleton protein RodZ